MSIRKSLSFLILLLLLVTPGKASANFLEKLYDHLVTHFLVIRENVDICKVENPQESLYKGIVVKNQYQTKLEEGENFVVQIKIYNNGNAIWYGDHGMCKDREKIRLGTYKDFDRVSRLMARGESSGWLSGNRIRMIEPYVKPGDIATFRFEAAAPTASGIYIEYFAPVVENVTWMPESEVKMKFEVGEITDEDVGKLFFMTKSMGTPDFTLADRNILIDISDQQMRLRLGEESVYTFVISSGKASTPTFLGDTQIFFKQEVRVSGGWPRYIMSRYQAFSRNGAYGLHALPSLANDKGVYWREALTHIGQPRSHGCVRLLPDDAELLWRFTDVGTPVKIQW